MPERRGYKRFEANTTAIIRKGVGDRESFLLENISARGAGILGYKPFAVDEKLTVLFSLPFLVKRSIQKQARVAWCKLLRDGVWECGLDFGSQNLLLHF